jgi:hypothetical protein
MADEEKKKVIIALWGPQDTGKTTTLRKLALEFLDSPEVEEDIQVGFLYYKGSEKKPTKIVVSTIKDARVNADFCTGLMAKTLILVTTVRTKGEGEKTNVVAKLVKKEDADLKSKKIKEQAAIDNKLTPKIEELISSIANDPIANGETAALRLFLLRLLKSEVVGDIQIAFRYKDKKIVISTAGDDKKVVKESIDLSKLMQADILVTAIRAEESPEEPLKGQLEEYTKDIRWIQRKCATSEQDQANEEQVKELQNKINSIIGIREKE